MLCSDELKPDIAELGAKNRHSCGKRLLGKILYFPFPAALLDDEFIVALDADCYTFALSKAVSCRQAINQALPDSSRLGNSNNMNVASATFCCRTKYPANWP